MITVRMAKESDIEGVLKLIHEFQKEGMDEFGLYCDDTKARAVICSNIEHSIILEADGNIIGCIGGKIGQGMVSTDKVYEEMIWYVTKAYRSHGVMLLRALEKMCKEWGVNKILMVHVGNLKAEQMREFYLRQGYKFLESHYLKEI